MPDGAIVDPTTETAPKDYTLTGSQEILVKSVRAVIDGTGAGSAFLPTLQLLDPNGHVMWEGATSETVAAGGSADVSWFPGLGGTGGASAAFAQWFRAVRSTTFTMGAGAEDTLPWTSLESSNSSLFSLGTDNHPNDAVQIAEAGVVICSSWVEPGALEPDFILQLLINNVGTGVVGEATFTPQTTWDTKGLPSNVQTFGPRDVSFVIPQFVPFQITSRYKNYDASSRTLSSGELAGFWWPTGTLLP